VSRVLAERWEVAVPEQCRQVTLDRWHDHNSESNILAGVNGRNRDIADRLRAVAIAAARSTSTRPHNAWLRLADPVDGLRSAHEARGLTTLLIGTSPKWGDNTFGRRERRGGLMTKYKICSSCKGKTWCSTCGGRGKVGTWVTKKCPVCNGRNNCQRCGGTGKVKYT
jgi:hypothetical protein